MIPGFRFVCESVRLTNSPRSTAQRSEDRNRFRRRTRARRRALRRPVRPPAKFQFAVKSGFACPGYEAGR